MAENDWPTKRLAVTNLLLDDQNPRLSPASSPRAQREIVQYLFDHEDALEVAQSIARNGYFQNEGLLATRENGRYVVLEGNRRLAALKALNEPEILEGRYRSSLQRLLHERGPLAIPRQVPVTLAPDRAATDRQIAVRHAGTAVRRWRTENKANFILSKLEGGYDEHTLTSVFGFTATEIRDAREVRALATMARSLELDPELKQQLQSPDPQIISTLHRFFDSPPGRAALQVERDGEQIFRVRATKADFVRGFTRVVTDVLTGVADSRKWNTHDNIAEYTKGWSAVDQVPARKATFSITDLTAKADISTVEAVPTVTRTRSKQVQPYVLPKSLAAKFGPTRMVLIRNELTSLAREKFPNAGAVLLRVFFELMVLDYLERTGELTVITQRLKDKNALRGHGQPEMNQLIPEIIKIGKARLPKAQAEAVERALSREKWLDDFNAFVHRPSDVPTAADLLKFWERMEPLFRLMLEQPIGPARP